ncbi:hypothetical protein DFH06DRAFT_1327349 [Mycena polygramma]|nr:hypothetical protein DFH06DRAFT_1327349 [Mycena polygramma]
MSFCTFADRGGPGGFLSLPNLLAHRSFPLFLVRLPRADSVGGLFLGEGLLVVICEVCAPATPPLSSPVARWRRVAGAATPRVRAAPAAVRWCRYRPRAYRPRRRPCAHRTRPLTALPPECHSPRHRRPCARCVRRLALLRPACTPRLPLPLDIVAARVRAAPASTPWHRRRPHALCALVGAVTARVHAAPATAPSSQLPGGQCPILAFGRTYLSHASRPGHGTGSFRAFSVSCSLPVDIAVLCYPLSSLLTRASTLLRFNDIFSRFRVMHLSLHPVKGYVPAAEGAHECRFLGIFSESA